MVVVVDIVNFLNKRIGTMNNHELKTINPHFKNLWCGAKKFEIRKNDRDFQVADIVTLREWDKDSYTERFMRFKITHILTHEDFPEGINEGYCVMSLRIFSQG